MNKEEFDMLKIGDKVLNKRTGNTFILEDKNTYSERLGDYFFGVSVEIKTTRVFPDDVWEKCE